MIANKPTCQNRKPRSRNTPVRMDLCVGRTSLALASLVLAAVLPGCQKSPRTGDPVGGLIVYVDVETREPVINLLTSEVPTINPQTGKRTLMPGLYCPTCQRWHPAPAFDTLQRTPGAGRCPTDGTPLTSDGPWPTGDQQ